MLAGPERRSVGGADALVLCRNVTLNLMVRAKLRVEDMGWMDLMLWMLLMYFRMQCSSASLLKLKSDGSHLGMGGRFSKPRVIVCSICPTINGTA